MLRDLIDSIIILLFGNKIFSENDKRFFQSIDNYLDRSHKEVADILNRL